MTLSALHTARFVIRGLTCLSPFGDSLTRIGEALVQERSAHRPLAECGGAPVATLPADLDELVSRLSIEERYKRVDRVTLLALLAARRTLAERSAGDPPIGCVSIGSSRGATISLESTMAHMATHAGAVPTHTSPATTAGNISSWVAQEVLAVEGVSKSSDALASISTSMTCTSAFHSLLVALAFVRGGLASACIFGGAEACLTPYTISQLEALRIYSKAHAAPWPGQPLKRNIDGEVHNTVTLGEGAGTAVLERLDGEVRPGDLELLGVGWSIERIPSATGLSLDGQAFEAAMRSACAGVGGGKQVDTVIAHAPGTARGDEAEIAAIARVCGSETPVVSTKHVTGHTYGASGMVSLQLAEWLVRGGTWPGLPYPARVPQEPKSKSVRTVLINTAGFGGNAISVLVGVPG